MIKRGERTTKRDERAGGSVGGKSEWAAGMEIAFLSVLLAIRVNVRALQQT